MSSAPNNKKATSFDSSELTQQSAHSNSSRVHSSAPTTPKHPPLVCLPEVTALQDFTPPPTVPKPLIATRRHKGLLERRGSNTSLTLKLVQEPHITKSITNLTLAHNETASSIRRKSLSNENLYVPPPVHHNCNVGGGGTTTTQPLTEDFKLHLQNIQYLQAAGRSMRPGDFEEVLQEDRVPKLHAEFWEVPLNLQEKYYVSGTQCKNRYKGVLPNEHSRVRLPDGHYIHANYIKGPDYLQTAYIATQGPMSHTCQDFWDMIWYTNCDSVVMLTGIMENGRNKCELYFPLGDEHHLDDEELDMCGEEVLYYGPYKITCIQTELYAPDWSLRTLQLRHIDRNETHNLKHYWYTKWRDHKMANSEHLLTMALHLLDAAHTHPIIVHCSAGIGRTGCFLAILNGIQQLNNSKTCDVLAILCSLRLNRGGMVQTAEQYEFVHRVLQLYTTTNNII